MCDCAKNSAHVASGVPIDCLVAEVDQILKNMRPRFFLAGNWPNDTQIEKILVQSLKRPDHSIKCRCASPRPVAVAGEPPGHVRDAVEAAETYLDALTRKRFESLLGMSFAHVRISTGIEAEHSAEALEMRAYTVGDTIVFGRNQFAPGSLRGDWLLTHELVHVMQQFGMDRDGVPDAAYLRRLEWQADDISNSIAAEGFAGRRIAAGLPVRPLVSPQLIQGVSVGRKGRACMGFGCPVAVPDTKTGNSTGCVIADCDRPAGPSPPVLVDFFCLYSCESNQGALLLRTRFGWCGPIYTIV